MSAGHKYRRDGFCSHPECYRHKSDEPGYDLCPAGGAPFGTRKLPADKEQVRLADRRAVIVGFAVQGLRALTDILAGYARRK